MSTIYVKETLKYGRGIFAGQDIARGELVEVSPVLIIPEEDWEKYKKDYSLQLLLLLGSRFGRCFRIRFIV